MNARRIPDFMIIGGMKCMTSTLHEQLALQPGFFMTEPKEPFYFSNDEVFEQGPDWYASLFAEAKQADICGESSTHYAKLPTYPKTVDRIAEACPNAKFIYIMRHPIDRLVSQYVHEWTMNLVADPIDDAIASFPAMESYSRYVEQLKPFLKTFGPDRVMPMFFDRLRHHRQEELQRAADFLGYGRPVEWQDDLGAQNVSAERMRESGFRDALTYAPGLSWIRKNIVPQSVRDKIKGRWQMQKRPELSDARREELTVRFNEDLAVLGSWLGFDNLTCTNFKSVTREQIPVWSSDVAETVGFADRPTDGAAA